MPLPWTTAPPLGPAGSFSTGAPSTCPVGLVSPPVPGRRLCAARKFIASMTNRRTDANLTFAWEFFIVRCPRCRYLLLVLLNEMNRRSQKSIFIRLLFWYDSYEDEFDEF